MDRLTKSVHFIPVKTMHRPHQYAELYVSHIVCLHGVPKSIVPDRGPQFIARFLQYLHKEHGTNLIQSSLRSDQEGESNFGRCVESMCSVSF